MVPKNLEGEHLCPIEIAQQFEGETRIVSLLKPTIVAQSITFGTSPNHYITIKSRKLGQVWLG